MVHYYNVLLITILILFEYLVSILVSGTDAMLVYRRIVSVCVQAQPAGANLLFLFLLLFPPGWDASHRRVTHLYTWVETGVLPKNST